MIQLSVLRPLAALVAVSVATSAALLAGCGSTPREAESQWSAERLYSEAKEEASTGNFERAGRLYERLEGRASGTALAQQAQIERAYMLYKSGDKAQALSVLERFIKLHPTSAASDYALYLQGLVNFNDNLGLLGSLARQDLSERDQQASRDSYQSFRQLTDQYPQSIYADDARLRMNYIVNTLAAYEVHVARYYYSRGAYVSAVNRAQAAITDYRDVPALEEAMFILYKSYDALGLQDLRDDAKRVLATTYPKSDYITKAFKSPKDAWYKIW